MKKCNCKKDEETGLVHYGFTDDPQFLPFLGIMGVGILAILAVIFIWWI